MPATKSTRRRKPHWRQRYIQWYPLIRLNKTAAWVCTESTYNTLWYFILSIFIFVNDLEKEFKIWWIYSGKNWDRPVHLGKDLKIENDYTHMFIWAAQIQQFSPSIESIDLISLRHSFSNLTKEKIFHKYYLNITSTNEISCKTVRILVTRPVICE